MDAGFSNFQIFALLASVAVFVGVVGAAISKSVLFHAALSVVGGLWVGLAARDLLGHETFNLIFAGVYVVATGVILAGIVGTFAAAFAARGLFVWLSPSYD